MTDSSTPQSTPDSGDSGDETRIAPHSSQNSSQNSSSSKGSSPQSNSTSSNSSSSVSQPWGTASSKRAEGYQSSQSSQGSQSAQGSQGSQNSSNSQGFSANSSTSGSQYQPQQWNNPAGQQWNSQQSGYSQQPSGQQNNYAQNSQWSIPPQQQYNSQYPVAGAPVQPQGWQGTGQQPWQPDTGQSNQSQSDQQKSKKRDGFGALFEFNFSRFITPSLAKLIYIVSMVMWGLGWLVMILLGFSLYAAIQGMSYSRSSGPVWIPVMSIIFGWIPGFIGVIITRAFLEVVLSVMMTERTAEEISNKLDAKKD